MHPKYTWGTRKVPTFLNHNPENNYLLVPPNRNRFSTGHNLQEDHLGSTECYPLALGQQARYIRKRRKHILRQIGEDVIETGVKHTVRKKQETTTTLGGYYPGKNNWEDGQKMQGHILSSRSAIQQSQIYQPSNDKSKNCWRKGTRTTKRIPTSKQRLETMENECELSFHV